MGHTPTPWRIAGKKTIRYGAKSPGTLQEGGWIADCTWNNGEANAKFIVTAVNNHAGLVAALNYVADMTFIGTDCEWHFKPGYDPQVVLDALSAASASETGREG